MALRHQQQRAVGGSDGGMAKAWRKYLAKMASKRIMAVVTWHGGGMAQYLIISK